MRDSEPRPKDDLSVSRIIVLGDSTTFGFGVAGENTYSDLLERFLNGKSNANQFEVLNFGVGGYSTQDEELVLEFKGLSWNPDLVIIGYSLNDPETDPIQPLDSYFQKPSWWQYSNILRLIAKAKNGADISLVGDGDYIRYLHAPQQEKWQSVVQAFEKIDSMTRVRNIPVLLAIFPMIPEKSWSKYRYKDLHHQVATAATRKGFYVIDLYDAYSVYPAEHLRVSSSDRHPNKLGHQLAANVIYDWLLKNGEMFAFRLSKDQMQARPRAEVRL